MVAVSKYYPAEAIERAYKAGQRVFAESRPQDFAAKVEILPKDIEWHFIGHLQTNKLKLVLLDEIEKWGKANDHITDILLEIHIGAEQTKQGFAEEEALEILFNADKFPHVRFRGLMAMATNTDDESVIDADFARIDTFMAYVKDLFPELEAFDQLSIGMSGDYKIALRHGATMVRIGTAIFAE